MEIPFHKPYLDQKEIDSAINAIKSGWLTMGPKTIEFENSFSKYIGSEYSISTNSATAALHLALSVLGIKEGDEVIIPTNTFTSTAESIIYTGAKPVLCDIDYSTHNIDVAFIEKLITKRTKAIIPVHFGGYPCDMNEIKFLANKYNLYIIEDAAHALPSFYYSKMIGTISDITCFSFYATKTLSTGEGGMLTTNNKDIAEKVKLKRLHGISRDAWKRQDNDNDWFYEVVDLGYKYNLTDIHSSIGIEQLKKVDLMHQQRKKIASLYKQALASKIECITELSEIQSSWHLFVIKVDNRNELYKKLKENGIKTSVHFIPIHRHPFYKRTYSYIDTDYPVANKVYEESLSLPIYPGLNNNSIEYIINNILNYI